MSVRAINADCLQAMADLAAEGVLVDAVVTDPPYHLTSINRRYSSAESMATNHPVYKRHARGFMGKGWDGGDIAMRPETWRLVYDLLKPGAHLVAFGGTRTHHRIWCAIEDAGFEIRDTIGWLYGSGFPKSHNAGNGRGTALKPALEPICLARKPLIGTVAANVLAHGTGAINIDSCRIECDGEHVRKGVVTKRTTVVGDERTGAALGRYGEGASFTPTNHPGGRWPANVVHDGSEEVLAGFPDAPGQQVAVTGNEPTANSFSGAVAFGGMKARIGGYEPRSDSGSAARFFKSAEYTEDDLWYSDLVNFAADCSSLQNAAVVFALRNAVARSMPESALLSESYRAPSTSATASELKLLGEIVTAMILSIAQRFSCELPLTSIMIQIGHARSVATPGPTGTMTITVSHWRSAGSAEAVTFDITLPSEGRGEAVSRFSYCAKADATDRFQSKHPTIKPLDLMQWLCRLVTPPGGLILDPFAGSGTTGEAAQHEGFRAILIEREAEYFADIQRRLGRISGADTPLFQVPA